MKYIYEEESLPSVKANAEIAQFAQGCLNTNSYFLLTRIDYIKPRSHPSLRSLLYSVCSVCSQGASKALCRAVQGPPCEKGERNLNRRMPRREGGDHLPGKLESASPLCHPRPPPFLKYSLASRNSIRSLRSCSIEGAKGCVT